MSLIKRNLLSNFGGSGWTALMNLLVIPYYIKLMGAESYGLIGLMASMQTVTLLLDLGLSQGLNREMARLSVLPNSADKMLDTARTLELIYWGIAIILFLFVISLSDFIANHWLKFEKLSVEVIVDSIKIMGILLAIRWPISIYSGGFNGLQNQMTLNVINAVFGTLQGAGGVAVLFWVKPEIKVLLLWQVIISLFQVVVMRILLWRSIPSNRHGKFTKDVIRQIWRFSAGMTGITLTSVLLMQTDKILLSKILSISDFGYYTFASTIAGVIFRITNIVFTTYYPNLTALASGKNEIELIRTYHRGCQMVSILIIPLAVCLVVFSKDVLLVWTRDIKLSSEIWLIMSLLVIGNTLSGLMAMPFLLQLAYAWTRISFYSNLILIIAAIPGIYFVTLKWGSVGAATIWILINLFYLLFNIHLIHRKLLISEKWKWYFNDIGKIIAAVIVIVIPCGYFISSKWSPIVRLLFMMCTGGISLISAVFVADSIRPVIIKFIKKILPSKQPV